MFHLEFKLTNLKFVLLQTLFFHCFIALNALQVPTLSILIIDLRREGGGEGEHLVQGAPGDLGEREAGAGVGEGVGAAPRDGVVHVTVVYPGGRVFVQVLP